MAAPFLPNILFYEDFVPSSASGVEPMQACIVGPHAQLVRYGQPDEKALGSLGAYSPELDKAYAWPNRQTGGKVDLGYAKLFADDAKLVFYTKAQGSGSAATVVSSSRLNRVQLAGSAGFKANGSHPRLSGLYGRDVQLGDRVRVTGVVGGSTYTADSYVTGFDGTTDAAVVASSSPDSANKASQTQGTTPSQTAGVSNCNTISADLTNYNGLVDGGISDTYTVTVIQSSVGGDISTGLLKIKSASGLDDVSSIAPATAGTYKTVGVRGLQIRFSQSGSCDLVAGQTWQIVVLQGFTVTSASSGGAYTGSDDDTYVVTVTRGGVFGDSNPLKQPQWTVTTVKGLDSSGPFTIGAANTAYPIGTKGVTLKFTTGLTGVCKGDRFYVPVTAAKLGVVNTLVLANPLPSALVSATDMTLQLYAQKSLEVPRERAGFDPLVNYAADASGITVYNSIVVRDPAFVDDLGQQLALSMIGGSLYAEYRAWLPQLAATVGSISDVGAIGTIAPGAVDPDNPLTYNLSRALLTANGAPVLFVAVADPDSPSSWATAIGRLVGRADVYDIVPLTYDPSILALFVAHVNDQSGPEKGLERRMVIGLRPTLSEQLVGPATSSDSNIVLATATDDPDASGTQYTLLTSANANFITNGVQPGDEARFMFTSSFGESSHTSFVVDRVVSESSLVLTSGVGTPVTTAQRLEVWHSLSVAEIVEDLKAQAAAYHAPRVIAVWSDLIGLASPTTETYSMAAALAGQMAGVLPQQGLTNATLPGFADVVSDHGILTDDQVADLAGNGVWVVSRTPRFQSNAVITRLATSTSPDDITTREEMVRRNVDSMIKYVRGRLSVYLQGTNVTPSSASLLRVEVDAAHAYLKASGFTQSLGGQLVDGVLDSIRQHAVFADRYVINVTWTIPVPLNTIEFHIAVVTLAAAS